MLVLTLSVEWVCLIACINHDGMEVSDRISQPNDLLKLARGTFLGWLFYCGIVNRALRITYSFFKHFLTILDGWALGKVEMGQ